jgi:hypothetical protein
LTTIGAEGTIVCPLEAKKSRNFCRISFDVNIACKDTNNFLIALGYYPFYLLSDLFDVNIFPL